MRWDGWHASSCRRCWICNFTLDRGTIQTKPGKQTSPSNHRLPKEWTTCGASCLPDEQPTHLCGSLNPSIQLPIPARPSTNMLESWTVCFSIDLAYRGQLAYAGVHHLRSADGSVHHMFQCLSYVHSSKHGTQHNTSELKRYHANHFATWRCGHIKGIQVGVAST